MGVGHDPHVPAGARGQPLRGPRGLGDLYVPRWARHQLTAATGRLASLETGGVEGDHSARAVGEVGLAIGRQREPAVAIWSDGDLGCGAVGVDERTATVPGTLIVPCTLTTPREVPVAGDELEGDRLRQRALRGEGAGEVDGRDDGVPPPRLDREAGRAAAERSPSSDSTKYPPGSSVTGMR